MAHIPGPAARRLLALAAPFALIACGDEPADTTYETDVVDKSGGELIVTEDTPAVEVDLPETEMTNVPATATATATATPTAEPTG